MHGSGTSPLRSLRSPGLLGAAVLSGALLAACGSGPTSGAGTGATSTSTVSPSNSASPGNAGAGGGKAPGKGGSSASPTTPSATASSPTASSTLKEYSPAGDIPDNQVFVPYTPPGAHYSIQIPEGWSRSSAGGAVTFTDKLNSVRIESVPAASAPTVASATSKELPRIAATATNYAAGAVTTVDRKAGTAVLVTYQADAPPDPVTGKYVRDAVERYEFWRQGTEAILTLSGPVGADNVDPWRIVSDSFAWK
ncbi:MAG: hypothetical protein ACR2KL_06210 [Nocardioidaceae bacterium]